MTKISVVIPTFNRSSLVQAALASVFEQTRPAHEIIVVNDGSTDDTAEVLATFGDRIRVVTQANSGLSAARNAGVEVATSEWVAFLDDDDEYASGRLQAAADSIAKFPTAEVHAVNLLIVRPNEQPLDLFSMRGLRLSAPTPLTSTISWVLRGCFFTQSLVVRKKLLEKVGGFRHFPFEDLDMFVRLVPETTWIADPNQHVRLIRRPNSTYTLSANLRARRIQSYGDLVRVQRQALELPSLVPADVAFVKQVLGSNLYALGRALHDAGRKDEAQVAFREARMTSVSLRSKFKVQMVELFGSPALFLVRQFDRFRTEVVR
jgi:hypothetical protein